MHVQIIIYIKSAKQLICKRVRTLTEMTMQPLQRVLQQIRATGCTKGYNLKLITLQLVIFISEKSKILPIFAHYCYMMKSLCNIGHDAICITVKLDQLII